MKYMRQETGSWAFEDMSVPYEVEGTVWEDRYIRLPEGGYVIIERINLNAKMLKVIYANRPPYSEKGALQARLAAKEVSRAF